MMGTIDKVKELFKNMKDKQDLLELLNIAKADIYGVDSEPFNMSQLNYHCHSSLNSKRYNTFMIKKKSGGDRIITAPNVGLKAFQRCLNYIFQIVYTPNNNAFGFIPHKSVVDNASVHIGQNYVYNIDLKDFFPSNESGRVYKRLQVKPFNMSPEVASVITDLCCHPMEVERLGVDGNFVKVTRSVLPQGAPTSPTITNIICERLDRRLTKLAGKYGLRYSRYADDITFSSMHNVYQQDSKFLKQLRMIVESEGYLINEKKTRLQRRGWKQEVTGLVVSKEKVNVDKKYIRQLRGMLHCWEKYGLADLRVRFQPRYFLEKGHVKKGDPDVVNVIYGKLLYLRMVKGKDDSQYLSLQRRYDKLTNIVDSSNIQANDVLRDDEMESVLKMLEKSNYNLSVLDKK